MHHLERQAGQLQHVAFRERPHVGRRRGGGRETGTPRRRIDQRQFVGLVDVEGKLRPAQIGGGSDVIVMAMRPQSGYGPLGGSREQTPNALSLEPRIDDHRLLPAFHREEPAVRVVRVVRERFQVHLGHPSSGSNRARSPAAWSPARR